MRVFSLLALMMFSSTVLAADFQLPDLALGTAKAEIKPEILNKTTMQLFQTDAKVDIQWTEDKVAALQLTFYQDADYEVLRQKTSTLLTQVSYQFGAVNWVSAEAGATSEQTLEQQLSLLDQVLKTAPQTAASYKQSHLANATMVLDFQPSPQPDNSRLHIQASYSSLNNSYSLKLFIDEKTAAERTGFAIVNLEAF